jgi:hypothetical protein
MRMMVIRGRRALVIRVIKVARVVWVFVELRRHRSSKVISHNVPWWSTGTSRVT